MELEMDDTEMFVLAQLSAQCDMISEANVDLTRKTKKAHAAREIWQKKWPTLSRNTKPKTIGAFLFDSANRNNVFVVSGVQIR